jgi:hypothetical protein
VRQPSRSQPYRTRGGVRPTTAAGRAPSPPARYPSPLSRRSVGSTARLVLGLGFRAHRTSPTSPGEPRWDRRFPGNRASLLQPLDRGDGRPRGPGHRRHGRCLAGRRRADHRKELRRAVTLIGVGCAVAAIGLVSSAPRAGGRATPRIVGTALLSGAMFGCSSSCLRKHPTIPECGRSSRSEAPRFPLGLALVALRGSTLRMPRRIAGWLVVAGMGDVRKRTPSTCSPCATARSVSSRDRRAVPG